MTTYTLSGGCYWCLDAVFRKLRGVESSISGFTGGDSRTARYDLVATGKTKHVETVQVTFDETVLPVDTLLDLYFLIHDPTSLNKQGADEGLQYASVMWYTNDEQKQAFETARDRAQKQYDTPVVTRIEPLSEFYPVDAGHQDYYAANPSNPYCQVVISPKISKARYSFKAYFIDEEI